MAAGGRGQRELLALIHQHLLRGGYARAARELQAQLGQKLLPSLTTSLEEIFTHWQKTPSNSRRRKVTDVETAIPEKIRVPDPVSSSESSEKEEDEKEKTKAVKASIPLVTNSAVNVESSEDDDSSSEEETPAGKDAVMAKPAVVSGKAANSLHSPNKTAAPADKAVVASAVHRTVVSNKQKPNAPAASAPPAKAGQKLASPEKLGHAVAAPGKVGQSKAPVTTNAPESSDSSSSSESEEEKETPAVNPAAPKVELKQAAGAAESSSEESSDETSSEEELTAPTVQAKPAVKAVQVNAAPVKSMPAAPVSTKKSALKQTAVAPNQAKLGSATVLGAAKPDDTSESSDSSDNENEEPASVTQTKPPPKSSQAVPSPVKPTPAASLSIKAAPAKTLPSAQGKPAPKPAVPKQGKTGLERTAVPTKPAESTKPVESTDSSDSEEEELSVPVSQKRLTEQPGHVPNLSQAAKVAGPEKAVGGTLKSQTSESGSSDSSDSEEETPVAQKQPPPAVKTNAVPKPTSAKKAQAPAPVPAPAPPPAESSDDSSEESDSEEEIIPPSQVLPPPCLKQTAPTGKAPPANTAAPQAASVLRNPTAMPRKPGLQPAQDTKLSQAVLPTQAEETSDSSSSSDSDEEETAKQLPKPGVLQKPGGTEPAHSSSSESSEEEGTASQSLLTGYLGVSKMATAPQIPKTVPSLPAGKAGQGKAAVPAANPLTKASVTAAPGNSSSSDSSDSDTDVEQVPAVHKAEDKPPPGQEAMGPSGKEKAAGKTALSPASLKASPVKKALTVKQNDVGAKGTQATPLSHTLLSIPESEESSSGSESEVTTAAKIPAVQTLGGLEEKKKKKKEKKEKKEKKKPSSTADKAVKTPKSKDKENKKQKASQKRKLPGEDGAVGQPKEKKRKGQASEEVPKKKKKKAAGDLEKLPGSKEKKKSNKKKKNGKEKKKKGKKASSEGEPLADGSAEVHKKKKKVCAGHWNRLPQGTAFLSSTCGACPCSAAGWSLRDVGLERGMELCPHLVGSTEEAAVGCGLVLGGEAPSLGRLQEGLIPVFSPRRDPFRALAAFHWKGQTQWLGLLSEGSSLLPPIHLEVFSAEIGAPGGLAGYCIPFPGLGKGAEGENKMCCLLWTLFLWRWQQRSL
uniref:Treacle ribosome biosis factor 1 n=1 Tax=Dromaius novaehollandiae TaxID=8790 RepID=A0A8C4PB41_DRONO